MIKCPICKGYGLIKNNVEPKCKETHKNIPFCYKCESIKNRYWEECLKCLGAGKIKLISS